MKFRKDIWITATYGAIFYLALIANGQSQDRISKKSSLAADQVNSRVVRGSYRFNSQPSETPINTFVEKSEKDESSHRDDSNPIRRKANYRTVSRIETEKDKGATKNNTLPEDISKTSKRIRSRTDDHQDAPNIVRNRSKTHQDPEKTEENVSSIRPAQKTGSNKSKTRHDDENPIEARSNRRQKEAIKHVESRPIELQKVQKTIENRSNPHQDDIKTVENKSKRRQETRRPVPTKPPTVDEQELLIHQVDAGQSTDVGSPMPRPTRQSESRRGSRHFEEKNTLKEPSEIPRRRPISRSKQLKETEITKLEVVSESKSTLGDNRRSRSRNVNSENRRMGAESDATKESKTVVSSRRATRTQNVEKEPTVLAPGKNLPKRGSVRGPKLLNQRSNPSKKDLDFEIDEDDNYPQEFFEKIKKSSPGTVPRLSSSKEDVVDVDAEETTVSRSIPSISSTDKNTINEETIPKLPARSSIFHNRRRTNTNTSRVNNNVTPLPATTVASVQRTASLLRTRANFRARASPLVQAAPSTTSQPPPAATFNSPPSSRPELRSRFTKTRQLQDEDNSINPSEENNIEIVQKLTGNTLSQRPSFKPRQQYIPKSRLITTSERSQAIAPIKLINSSLRRSSLSKTNPDTPRPLRPLISSRLRTYSSQVTQQYINEVLSTTPVIRTQGDSLARSVEPTKSQNDEQDNERSNFVRMGLKSRYAGVKENADDATERVRFKPSTTEATSERYTPGFRKSLKRTTNTEAVEKRLAAQQVEIPPKQRFSSRYRGDTNKLGRGSTPGYIPTLPSFSPTSVTSASDIQATNDVITSTIGMSYLPSTTTDPTPYSSKETSNDIEDTREPQIRTNPIITKPEVSNSIYTNQDSKYNNYWSSSSPTTEKPKLRFLTINLLPSASPIPTVRDQTAPVRTTNDGDTSTTVFRWKPVTDASIEEIDSTPIMATPLPSTTQPPPISLSELIYQTRNDDTSSVSTTESTLNIPRGTVPEFVSPSQEMSTEIIQPITDKLTTSETVPTTQSPTTSKPKLITTTNKPATHITIIKNPKKTATTKEQTTRSTATMQKPTTMPTTSSTTMTKPTTTTQLTTTVPSTTSTTTLTTTTTTSSTTTFKPTTSTTQKSTTNKPTTHITMIKNPKKTTTTTSTTTPRPTTRKTTSTTTKKPMTTTTKKPMTTTTKKPTKSTTTTKKPTISTTKSTTTSTTLRPVVITPSPTPTQETQQRYIDDILLLNTLLQAQAGPNVSPRTGRTQNAQVLLANQIIELALLRASTSTSRPKISTTMENDNYIENLLSASQEPTQETATKSSSPLKVEDTKSVQIATNELKVKGSNNLKADVPKVTTSKPKTTTIKNNAAPTLSDQELLSILLNAQAGGNSVVAKKPNPTKKPTSTTPAPSGLRWLLQALGGRNNQELPTRVTNTAANAPIRVRPQIAGVALLDDTPTKVVEEESPTATDPGLLSAAINVTRAVSQFMGIVIQGAAESFQNYVRQRTGGFLSNYFALGVANPSSSQSSA